ncbi:MAG: lipopolysaccharide biosynthesis protein [Ramlibacter sp.]|nr:lipopolysaccharide biosynthesis protein [Ramlibacter sp.]
MKLIERGIGFVSVLILARLLTPADFGLVAMAMSVVALIELMGAFGFDTALIQRQDATREHFDTAWTFGVLFGIASALLLIAAAVPAAEFYRDPRITLILPALAIGALLQGFENVGPVLFRKSLDFTSEFIFLLAKRLAGFAVTVSLALLYRNFWALVAGIITSKLIATVISYVMHSYRPRFSLAARADLFHFSKWLFISNLLRFSQENADKFILGRAIGPRDLGIYNVASEIAALPATVLIAPINRAVFPAYAKLLDSSSQLQIVFLQVVGNVAIIATPLAFGIACLAEPVVAVLLGPQWAEAVPLLRIFVAVGLVGALQSNLFSLLLAQGHAKANTMMALALLILYLPAVTFASVHAGAVGAAWTHLVMAFVGLVPLYLTFFRLTGFSRRAYIATLWRPLIAAGVASAVLTSALNVLDPRLGTYPLALLFAGSAIGAVVYALSLGALWLASGRPHATAEHAILLFIRRRAGLPTAVTP